MYLKQDLEFVGDVEGQNLIVPTGTKIDEIRRPSEPSDEYLAAEDCAKRIERETGDKAIITRIDGVLRVIERRWLTVGRREP